LLVVQHIWSRWTKFSRGADRPYTRPRLDPSYPLPPGAPGGEAFLHSIAADEWAREELAEAAGPVTRAEWQQQDGVLDWRLRGKEVDVVLHHPSRWRLQTKFPAWLPSPLFTLRPGESARIEWNGRFRYSLFGSNRSSYYEQHVYWLALAEAPGERLFLDAEPRKNIDYTTHIY
jgi:hypothetical protein